MSLLGSWVPSLRMARRDAVRHRGKSVLVLVMIALPVLGVTAADVVIQTSQVSGGEALDRRLGQADARVSFDPSATRVYQSFDPDGGSMSTECCADEGRVRDLDTVSEVLGRDVSGLPFRTGTTQVVTGRGVGSVEATETDLSDPLARGLFELKSGELPAAPDQVVINPALAGRGFAVGDDLEVVDGKTLTIVGIVESTTWRDLSIAVAPAGALSLDDIPDSWLVDAGPVSWQDVTALNEAGAIVLSRDVMTNPPPASELPEEIAGFGGSDEILIAVASLIVVMALLEVVLLAGPAFAVGARRQSRNLALMAASGGTPPQARRVVLASGIVLGTVGAVGGVGLGIAVGWLVLPIVQRFSGNWLGPFDVPWLHLLGIGAFGLLSAFLAAVVPAWIASRQDVVAVLAGRRGDRAPSLRSPLLGVVLLAVGIGLAVYGAVGRTSGELAIAAAAIVSVLGMILVVPVVVVGLAKVCARLPLVMRYAVRDAARHRTRTVPAVAAVAATVAGVVALGIANSSDEAENRETYRATLDLGDAVLTSYDADADVLGAGESIIEREIPGAVTTPVRGVRESVGNEYFYLDLQVPGREPGTALIDEYAVPYGSSVLVSDGEWPSVLQFVDGADVPRAEQALVDGKAVVFAKAQVDEDAIDVGGYRMDEEGDETRLPRVEVPAEYLEVTGTADAVAVIPSSLAERLGAPVATTAVVVSGADITAEQEQNVGEAVGALSLDSNFYVERGYQAPDETVILLLVLGALGAVLMLGGTLTATFLALSDARPDLATLSAVGAAPRTRRGVASAYALVVGVVGAVLGAAVGFIPGIAITYPLTNQSWMATESDVSHYLDIPWLLIGALVVVLPLLTAAIVGLTARSRLPMVARVD